MQTDSARSQKAPIKKDSSHGCHNEVSRARARARGLFTDHLPPFNVREKEKVSNEECRGCNCCQIRGGMKKTQEEKNTENKYPLKNNLI